MIAGELFEEVINIDRVTNIHPLHKAMLDECCENAINNQQVVTDKDTLIFAARNAFVSCHSLLKGKLSAGLEMEDTVTLNYRGGSYTFDKSSEFTKQILEN